MSDLQKSLNKVIKDIESNLSNKDDVEYVKNQIYSIYNIFSETLEKIEDKADDKMESLLIRCKTVEDRMKDMEDAIKKIESDIYIKDEEDDYEFNINCPYCDSEFFVDLSDGQKDVIVCPECNEEIELDWDDCDCGDEGCSHHCHDCGECDDCEDEDDDM